MTSMCVTKLDKRNIVFILNKPVLVYKFLHARCPNTSIPFSKSGSVPIKPVLVNLIVWSLKSLSLYPQFTNQLDIFVLALLIMCPKFGMICLMSDQSASFRKRLKAYLFSKAYPT